MKYGVIIQNQKELFMIARGSCKIHNALGSGVIQLKKIYIFLLDIRDL